MNSLLGIIYISKAQVEFDTATLVSLSEKAAQKNQELGVTGYLYFKRGEFLQYIEGGIEQVSHLMHTISLDHRHQVLHQEKVEFKERKFANWHMRYLSPSELREINMEYVIIKHLENLKSFKNSTIIQSQDVILRMIDRLSAVKNQLQVNR